MWMIDKQYLLPIYNKFSMLLKDVAEDNINRYVAQTRLQEIEDELDAVRDNILDGNTISGLTKMIPMIKELLGPKV